MNQIDIMANVLGIDGHGFRVVQNAFRYIAIAGEEAQAYEEKSGKLEFDRVISICQPTEVLRNKDEAVYRAHCRELFQRVELRCIGDLQLATLAEIACICHETSLRAPLTNEGLAVYERAMLPVYGAAGKEQPSTLGVEQYPGQVAEEITRLRKKYRQEWRR